MRHALPDCCKSAAERNAAFESIPVGCVWGGVVLLINSSFFWWLTPTIAPLILSVPLSAWSSSSSAGEKFRKFGLFLTPEEITPHPEFSWLESYLKGYRPYCSPLAIEKDQGFVRAVVDPCVNALHLSLLRKERRYSQAVFRRRQSLRDKALLSGPDRLISSEKKELLFDPASVIALHRMVWKTADEASSRLWGITLFPLRGK